LGLNDSVGLRQGSVGGIQLGIEKLQFGVLLSELLGLGLDEAVFAAQEDLIIAHAAQRYEDDVEHGGEGVAFGFSALHLGLGEGAFFVLLGFQESGFFVVLVLAF